MYDYTITSVHVLYPCLFGMHPSMVCMYMHNILAACFMKYVSRACIRATTSVFMHSGIHLARRTYGPCMLVFCTCMQVQVFFENVHGMHVEHDGMHVRRS